MTTINDELKDLCAVAGFTISDLATWCECGRGTMQEWVKNNTMPHPLRYRHLEERIELAKKELAKKNGRLPVPISITQYERKPYVIQVRDHALREFSKVRSSKRRVQMLDSNK